ncbi:MAG: HAMP domain-containing protein [Gomphosphaeria aponina SAG 52.96 = DSM 107014]|uniref:HAMP domain-containing protein n=1 Tax=Gomphosphaeria aponina SAG 52.96 = DSM 107014 TaxID=1521640 RepID=A0A941GSC0_9CHRO|nr:HAMP domain-containing protein [Gomphosphaeria aponina SAG 52.96 = DSM 107014]
MKKTQKYQVKQDFSAEIIALQTAVEQEPTDLVAKISLASALEQSGHLAEAVAVYRQISALDTEGVFAATAAKALAELGRESETEKAAEIKVFQPSVGRKINQIEREKKRRFLGNIFQKIANLPIGTKQFIALLSASAISTLAVVSAGMAIVISSGRSQLRNQAIAELAVTTSNYNAKGNEMATGFRGQADNTAIITAAKEYQEGKKLAPELKQSVKEILANEIKARQIEYATLVGIDGRIIVNGNQKDRSHEIFNPNNLVADVLEFPRRIQTNAIIDAEELAEELSSFPKELNQQNALMRFTFTPVEDPKTDAVIGLLVAGDLVNGKTSEMKKTVEAVGGGYAGVYLWEKENLTFTLATSVLQEDPQAAAANKKAAFKYGVPLPNFYLLDNARIGVGGDLIERQQINGEWFTFAVKALPNLQGERVVFLVRGTSEKQLNALLQNSLLLQMAVGVLTLLLAAILAFFLGKALTQPIKRLRKSAQQFGSGDRDVRAEETSQDEVGELAHTFNEMADRIVAYTQAIEEQSYQRQQEAQFQRLERERLQEGVIRLLLNIEKASQGDLTIEAEVDAGEVGSIADAFNATLRSLQQLVKQVQVSANEVHDAAIDNGKLVNQLSEYAINQEQAIEKAEQSIVSIAASITNVTQSAAAAAAIARKGSIAAAEGQETMDSTVDNIYNIRNSVADTSKKAKRLAESSQEISKIVSIISDISAKTNLLAFNASIEASRAGENGQGFRIVADEVRRLAEQVTFSAQEIEQLIGGIQTETAEMMQMMESSTTQVVMGTKLVQKTKATLQNLAQISEDIDHLLASISASTVSQRDTSQQVTQTIQGVAVISKKTASESQSVAQCLQNLLNVALDLQKSASNFKVD